jgi:hypothetical protein
MGIEVDRSSIDEVVAKAANYELDDFWMHFRTDNCTLGDFGDALQIANDADDEATYGEGGDRIPTGIVFIVVPLSEVDRFEQWLSLLVSGLEDRGATGRLEVIESVHAGNWPTEDPTPAVFVACTEDPDAVMVDERRRTAWHVPTDATREIITSAAAWAEAGGTHTSVKFGIFPLEVSPESDVASMLHTSLVDNKASGCTCYQPDQQRGRRVTIRLRGKVVMQAIGAQVPWQQRIEAEYEALTTLPNRHLDLAFHQTCNPHRARLAVDRQTPEAPQPQREPHPQQPSSPLPAYARRARDPGAHRPAPRPSLRPIIVDRSRDRREPFPCRSQRPHPLVLHNAPRP